MNNKVRESGGDTGSSLQTERESQADEKNMIKVVKVSFHDLNAQTTLQTLQTPNQRLLWQVDRDMTTHRDGVNLMGAGGGRRVCLCSSSLVLASGQQCHCDSQVKAREPGAQTESWWERGREREMGRKWEVGWEERLHPRMTHVSSLTLSAARSQGCGGIADADEMGGSPSLLHGSGQIWKNIHRQAGTHTHT